MRALILGGGGMVGQKLARHIAANGLNGEQVDITLHDIAFPSTEITGATQIKGSIADAGTPETLAKTKPDVIFHLASIVSGEAEADFAKGWAINMHPTWALLEALRAEHEADPSYRPRVVFTSSIAVFGGPYPDKISDEFLSAPQTSYGAQKAICEMLISDFSRKGFIDGISIRLPTICVRPGKPNAAASSFFSGIIREPLNGQEAILPVADTTRHWHASPRSATGFLTHAATLDTDRLQNRRALNLPGVSCTVAEQIEALRDLVGNDVVKLIKHQPDPVIQKIVEGWPRNFAPERALALGFKAEGSFKEIIQVYLDDELKRPT
ncbi:nucleoside-diphosphate-sugar epimerase [Litoreibacter meonggei]|uniref:Nucleoside-diphosphate-sugar epimerase n=1 Tax=Litoreibacter meonggei TaxID=1049199 RepID=A0A497X434_9RHOB|nr:D-erythronate dehydrogenase [Litoreibacter meonggei]RLJ59264.1 nucleoside-diphosphate-sugar epimerase [Litoreibacter meonggei]